MRWARLLLAFSVVGSASGPAQAADGGPTRLGGASVVWPEAVADGTVAPAARITVRVVRNRSGHPVVVSLIRVDGNNGLVARSRFRRGTFVTRVSRRAGARYRLHVRVGGHRRQTRFVVQSSGRSCRRADVEPTARLSLGATSGRAGEKVPAMLTNDGASCLDSGLKLQWQALQADGSFAAVKPPGPVTDELYTVLPGAKADFVGTVWRNITPGVHRAAVSVSSGDDVLVLTSEPFLVVP